MSKKVLLLSLLFVTPALAADRSLQVTGTVVKSFTVTCATTATAVVGTAGDIYTSLQCSALSTTPIYLGASTVTTANGYPICTDATVCGVSTEFISSNNLYCRVAAATETLKCLAVVR